VIDNQSQALLDKARATLSVTDGLISKCYFKDAIKAAMVLAQEANRYLDQKAPWKTIKTDKEAAGTSLYVTISVLSCLRIIFYPFLPFSSARLHEYLGFSGNLQDSGWNFVLPSAGQKLISPQPLFAKLDEKQLEEENRRLEQ
jgi:methionyl-tRNA synthetase